MSHFGSVITHMTATGHRPGALLAALLASSLALAGCARQQSQHAAQPQPAICQPRPLPDCEFKGTSYKTVDPTEFAQLKQAYEQRCIRRAERAERHRLRTLHASGACTAPSPAASR